MKGTTWRSITMLFVVAASALALGRLNAWASRNSWPAPGASVDAPRLTTGAQQRDLGKLAQGSVHRIAFAVANRGTRRLILIERGNCCGEETPPVQLVVPPEESLDVVVDLDTSRCFGRIRHVAEYDTNDPRTPRLALTVEALVE